VVGRVARDLGLPFIGRSLGITPGPNLQARARDARREALLAQGADHICTAHHEDDQAETVLLHLLRGSGAAGLKGIALADPPWCRPLLQEPKAVLRAWAEREGLRWTDDPSNPSSQRGELRRLLPALDNIHGGAQGALARSARLIARDDALLEALTEARCAQALDASGLDVALTRAEHPALQLRMLRRLVRASGCAEIVRADQLEAALPFEAREGSGLPLPGGWSLRVVGGRFTLQGPAEPAACAP
jgi:tRNA(Ile)-lysidine synthase